MVKVMYCWRCQMDMPMLEEEDWSEIGPLMAGAADPEVARQALDAYFRLTGVRETNVNAIWHHKTNEHGPPCRECGKPLRTDRASFCAACGTARFPSQASDDQTCVSNITSGEEQSRFAKTVQSLRGSKLSVGAGLFLALAVYAVAQAI